VTTVEDGKQTKYLTPSFDPIFLPHLSIEKSKGILKGKTSLLKSLLEERGERKKQKKLR
jgi:hypothetical protein